MAMISRRPYRPVSLSKDADDMIRQAGQHGMDAGADLTEEYGDLQDIGIRDFEDWSNNVDPIAARMMTGGGGYTPEQLASLKEHYGDLDQSTNLTSEEKDGLTLDDQESADIVGDPDASRDHFDPNAERQALKDGYDNVGDQIDNFEDKLEGSFDPEKLRMSSKYADRVLGSADKYSKETEGLGKNLGLSKDFADKYRMTPEQKQFEVDRAIRGVRDGSAAQEEELRRQSQVAGMDPMGVAAATSRMRRYANIDAQDAALNARMSADREAATREKDIEGMRLDAEGKSADFGRGLALERNNVQGAAAGDVERTRMLGEQTAAGMNVDAVKTIGGTRVGTAQQQVGDTVAQNADLRRTGMDMEQDIRDHNTDTKMQIAQHNQGGTATGAGMRTNLGLKRYDEKAGVNRSAVEANRSDVATGLAHGQARQSQGLATATGALAGKTQAVGNMTSAAQTAAGQASQAKQSKEQIKASKPSTFSRIMGGISQAAGMFL
jgi:hypothetical protein